DPSEPLHFGGHRIERFPVEAVADAYRDFGERVEHVQLGDRESGEPVDPHGVAHHHGVEPAAAAWASRGGPELVRTLRNPLAERWGCLVGQGSVADRLV